MAIESLIDKVDGAEMVRDTIAAILASESAAQQVLATADGQDPRLWALRVFRERTNSIEDYIDAPEQLDAAPVVNVSWLRSGFSLGQGNRVSQQRASAVFNIDCYGYGLAQDDAAGDGHTPGDLAATLEAQRVARLVRNIIMAGEYTYLGPTLRGSVVAGRWIQDIEFSAAAKTGAVNVVTARLTLAVDLIETAPQVEATQVDTLSFGVTIEPSGEVVSVDIPVPTP